MKAPFFSHFITACVPLLSLPARAWAAAEEPLRVTTPHFAPLDSMAYIGKLLAAFLIIAALMALLFKGLKKMGMGHGSLSKGGLISVLDTRLIAPKKYISVVRVAGEDLALAVSDNNITLLCKLGPAPASPQQQRESSAFDATLSKAHGGHPREAFHG